MSMPHTPFLVAAYAITLISLFGLLGLSWRRMRRAERALRAEQRAGTLVKTRLPLHRHRIEFRAPAPIQRLPQRAHDQLARGYAVKRRIARAVASLRPGGRGAQQLPGQYEP